MGKVFAVLVIMALVPMVALAEGVVKIGVVLPMTGGISAFGQMTWEGVKLAHELEPTVLGKKVELVLLDNRSDKSEAALAVRRAIDYEKVIAIIGEVASSHSLAGGQVAEQRKIPMVTPASTNPLVTQNKFYVSRVCFIDPFQGHVAAVFAYKQLGARKAAVFMDIEQDYCVGLAKFFIRAFRKFGGKTFVELYRTGDQEFSAQLTDAIAKNPDVIYVPGYYPEIALIARQARQLGYTGYILSGDGADAPELIKIGGEAVEGLMFTSHYHAKAKITPIAEKFVKLFREKYGEDPSALAALGFDAYRVLIDAIRRAGCLDPGKIAKAVRETKNFEGVTGWITIDKNGNAVKPAVILCVKNGRFDYLTTVTPEE